MAFKANAGVTYYLQVGDCESAGGELHLNVAVLPPPVNDDFAKATTVLTLPLNDGIDTASPSIARNICA